MFQPQQSLRREKSESTTLKGLVFTLKNASETDLKRAEELTLRTHQLNTTGYTHSYDDLDYFRRSADHVLLVGDLVDKLRRECYTMCGINVIYHFQDCPVDPLDLTKMAKANLHRGPDEAGYALLEQGRIGFAHNRLKVIDFETGRQPMYSSDQSLAITFNGEIYDYKELRKGLILKGHRFRTHSDTEVILNLYREYGLDFFEYLSGEFAFVLYDSRKKRIVATRDRAGVKPLFYHLNEHELVISSECKGILALNRMDRNLSNDYLTGTLIGMPIDMYPPFANIHSLKPGHYFISDINGFYGEKEYWRQQYVVDDKMSFSDAKEGVRYYFDKAVKRRLVADVPVGIYLSGGIDSTLVCAKVSQQRKAFTSFNIAFHGSAYDESDLAKKIAHHYGANFESVECTMDKLASVFRDTIYHTELALPNPHSIGKFILSEFVRFNKYRVCITGEGADEIFGGYPYFKLEKLWRMFAAGGADARRARKLWKKFRQIEKRSEYLLWDRGKNWKKLDNIFGYPSFHQLRAEGLSKLTSLVLNTEALGIRKNQMPKDHLYACNDAVEMKKLCPVNGTRQFSLAILNSYILPVLGDRVEMAHSVECRTPFLDRDLMEFTGKIPTEYLIDIERLREKYILHETFRSELPKFMSSQHKHPFLAPDWKCFYATTSGKELFEHYLSDELIKKYQVFNPRSISKLKKIWKILPKQIGAYKRLDAAMGLILSVQVLYERFIENRIEVDPHVEIIDVSEGLTNSDRAIN